MVESSREAGASPGAGAGASPGAGAPRGAGASPGAGASMVESSQVLAQKAAIVLPVVALDWIV